MTKERMIELMLLTIFINASDPNYFNTDKMYQRYLELRDEFLRPYVIDSNSKE